MIKIKRQNFSYSTLIYKSVGKTFTDEDFRRHAFYHPAWRSDFFIQR